MAEARPFVSVIVPTHGRPAALAAGLHELGAQTYPRDRFEVLVVADGSDPAETRALAECVEAGGARLLHQPHLGPAAARNLGAAHAHGAYLAFTDDDCRPDPVWLAALVAALAANPGAGAGGPIVNALPANPYAAASQALVGYVYAYYNRDPQRAVFLTSNNLALPAEGFHALGGFDCALRLAAAEDRDLCDRWGQRGYRLVYVPEAVVAHAPYLTARRFWAQHFRYGRGAHGYHLARRARGEPPVPVEPPAFYWNLLRHLATHAPPRRAALGALLAVTTQLANALGFFYERRRYAAAQAAQAAVPELTNP